MSGRSRRGCTVAALVVMVASACSWGSDDVNRQAEVAAEVAGQPTTSVGEASRQSYDVDPESAQAPTTIPKQATPTPEPNGRIKIGAAASSIHELLPTGFEILHAHPPLDRWEDPRTLEHATLWATILAADDEDSTSTSERLLVIYDRRPDGLFELRRITGNAIMCASCGINPRSDPFVNMWADSATITITHQLQQERTTIFAFDSVAGHWRLADERTALPGSGPPYTRHLQDADLRLENYDWRLAVADGSGMNGGAPLLLTTPPSTAGCPEQFGSLDAICLDGWGFAFSGSPTRPSWIVNTFDYATVDVGNGPKYSQGEWVYEADVYYLTHEPNALGIYLSEQVDLGAMAVTTRDEVCRQAVALLARANVGCFPDPPELCDAIREDGKQTLYLRVSGDLTCSEGAIVMDEYLDLATSSIELGPWFCDVDRRSFRGQRSYCINEERLVSVMQLDAPLDRDVAEIGFSCTRSDGNEYTYRWEPFTADGLYLLRDGTKAYGEGRVLVDVVGGLATYQPVERGKTVTMIAAYDPVHGWDTDRAFLLPQSSECEQV